MSTAGMPKWRKEATAFNGSWAVWEMAGEGPALTGYRSVIELTFVDFLFVASNQLLDHVRRGASCHRATG
jgi:hypothetical protein